MVDRAMLDQLLLRNLPGLHVQQPSYCRRTHGPDRASVCTLVEVPRVQQHRSTGTDGSQRPSCKLANWYQQLRKWQSSANTYSPTSTRHQSKTQHNGAVGRKSRCQVDWRATVVFEPNTRAAPKCQARQNFGLIHEGPACQ